MITREPEYFPPATNVFQKTGRAVLLSCRSAGRAVLMIGEAFGYLPLMAFKRDRAEVVRQMYVAGIKTLGVVTLVAAFTGMIMALQVGLELRDFGKESQVAVVVTEVMLREMGPVMSALIIAASVGSSMAARVGTMRVSDKIAALEVMSINPVRYLVTPRLLALLIMLPLTTVYANIVGIAGGALVAKTQLGVSASSYLDNAFTFSENKALYVGILKAAIFGVIITTCACNQGFSSSKGAEGVGDATRKAVVLSFLLILCVGYFLTRVFYS